MLIEKIDISEGDVIVFRLVSGEEVIAKLHKLLPPLRFDGVPHNVEPRYSLEKPMRIEFMPGPGGEASIGLMPLLIGAEDNAKIIIDGIKMLNYPVLCAKELKDEYLQRVSTLLHPMKAPI